MGTNISEVSGTFTGTQANGLDGWVTTVDLSDPTVDIVTGDFDSTFEPGEAGGGYVFSGSSPYGSLSWDATDGTFAFDIDRAAVIASGSDQTVEFTVVGTASNGFSDSDTISITILICMATGTLVGTPEGPRPVEEIRRGELVHTRDRGPRPVLWSGYREITAAELSADPDLRPVRIRAGALGGGLPWRDLIVSPQHRVLLTGWRAELMFGEEEILVPAKALVNDRDILVAHDMAGVTYHHILLDGHQIIETEGAPTESFQPGPASLSELDGAARGELLRLFPKLASQAPDWGPPARPILRVTEGRVLS